MDTKALADRLDTLSQRTRLDHEYIDLGAEELLIMLLTAKSAMREAARILRDVVPELEAHLESLQNRYALVTAENDTLREFQDCRDDKGDFLYEQWKDRQREKDDG